MKGESKEMDPAARDSRSGDIWGALQEVVRDNPRFWLYFSSVMIQVREAVLERAAAGSSRDFFPGYPKYRDAATQTETISVRDVSTQTEIDDVDCQDDKTHAICRKLTELTESSQSPDDVQMATLEDDKMAAQREEQMASKTEPLSETKGNEATEQASIEPGEPEAKIMTNSFTERQKSAAPRRRRSRNHHRTRNPYDPFDYLRYTYY
ncbi:uncharacterized protein LOC124413943 [Diprion similis]|uniref:uncharacterized protein LOC124413943 n=1 Tax=Diprion similis TaxID=362088 RepID=UPI001EF7C7CC|nr:uncharacterized protein LOC124413943 [Diprion similis]